MMVKPERIPQILGAQSNKKEAYRQPTAKRRSRSTGDSNADEDLDRKQSVTAGIEHKRKYPGGMAVVDNEGTPIFPMRLFLLLEEAETRGFGDVIRWLPDGKGFQVLSREMMEEVVIPLYFGATKWKSFQRQLNLYGFRSIKNPVNKERCFVHPLFHRYHRSLCYKIKRRNDLVDAAASPPVQQLEPTVAIMDLPTPSWQTQRPQPTLPPPDRIESYGDRVSGQQLLDGPEKRQAPTAPIEGVGGSDPAASVKKSKSTITQAYDAYTRPSSGIAAFSFISTEDLMQFPPESLVGEAPLSADGNEYDDSHLVELSKAKGNSIVEETLRLMQTHCSNTRGANSLPQQQLLDEATTTEGQKYSPETELKIFRDDVIMEIINTFREDVQSRLAARKDLDDGTT